jgi:hypothetical protein
VVAVWFCTALALATGGCALIFDTADASEKADGAPVDDSCLADHDYAFRYGAPLVALPAVSPGSSSGLPFSGEMAGAFEIFSPSTQTVRVTSIGLGGEVQARECLSLMARQQRFLQPQLRETASLVLESDAPLAVGAVLEWANRDLPRNDTLGLGDLLLRAEYEVERAESGELCLPYLEVARDASHSDAVRTSLIVQNLGQTIETAEVAVFAAGSGGSETHARLLEGMTPGEARHIDLVDVANVDEVLSPSYARITSRSGAALNALVLIEVNGGAALYPATACGQNVAVAVFPDANRIAPTDPETPIVRSRVVAHSDSSLHVNFERLGLVSASVDCTGTENSLYVIDTLEGAQALPSGTCSGTDSGGAEVGTANAVFFRDNLVADWSGAAVFELPDVPFEAIAIQNRYQVDGFARSISAVRVPSEAEAASEWIVVGARRVASTFTGTRVRVFHLGDLSKRVTFEFFDRNGNRLHTYTADGLDPNQRLATLNTTQGEHPPMDFDGWIRVSAEGEELLVLQDSVHRESALLTFPFEVSGDAISTRLAIPLD